jgi:hypothetical protein
MWRRLLPVLFFGVLSAQIPSTDKTIGMLNGRYWMGLSRGEKLGYILGAMEAASYSSTQVIIKIPAASTKDPVELMAFPDSLTFGEIVDEFDLVYATPTIRQIPVVWLFSYIKEKATGSSAPALEAHLQRNLRVIAIMAAAEAQKP